MHAAMTVMLTGRHGFVGRHVEWRLGVQCHTIVETFESQPNALMHLAWEGLPNYESEDHYTNVEWQAALIKEADRRGIKNITIAGTCLETVEHPPHYAKAKQNLCKWVMAMNPKIKWVRLPWLYGTGQRSECLLPSLQRAVKRGDKQFHVAPTKKVFADVANAAEMLCRVMHDTTMSGIIDWLPSSPVSVADFCRSHLFGHEMELIEDYPLKEYEK